MRFQSAQHVPRQRWLRRTVVPQLEVAAFVFLVAFLLLPVLQCLFKRRLHFPVGLERK